MLIARDCAKEGLSQRGLKVTVALEGIQWTVVALYARSHRSIDSLRRDRRTIQKLCL